MTNFKTAKELYHSREWKVIRKKVHIRDFGICQKCRKPIKTKNFGIVDHIIPLDLTNLNDPKINLNLDNLELLCYPCHNKKTHSKTLMKSTRSINFDKRESETFTFD